MFAVLYLSPERQALRKEQSKFFPFLKNVSYKCLFGFYFLEGKPLPDEETLGELNLPATGAQLFLRDLGRQIGWKTVRTIFFLCMAWFCLIIRNRPLNRFRLQVFVLEYFGPLIVYYFFYSRPVCVYGEGAKLEPKKTVVK